MIIPEQSKKISCRMHFKGAVSLRITELKEGEILEVGYEMVTKALENSTLRIKFLVTIFNYE